MDFIEEVIAFLQQHSIRFERQRHHSESHLFTEKLLLENTLLIHCISLNESLDCFPENEFRQINLWEDVWKTKKAICQSRILAMLGISQRVPARLTTVRRIDKKTLDNFLIINHLQVTTQAKFKYGLFLPKHYFRVLNASNYVDSTENELLVAVASFSSARNFVRDHQSSRSFELIRFANKLHHTVVGGLDKLLKNFIKEQNPDDIMTYADRDWSAGRSYEKVGFKKVELTPPQNFWVNKSSMERFYQPPKDELSSPNFVQISNAGNIKFLLNLKMFPADASKILSFIENPLR